MVRTKESPKKVISPGLISPSRQLNSAPGKSNVNALLVLSHNQRKRRPSHAELPTVRPTLQNTATNPFLNINITKSRSDENCDSNQTKDDNDFNNKGKGKARDDIENNNKHTSGDKQVTLATKPGSKSMQRRHTTKTRIKSISHIDRRTSKLHRSSTRVLVARQLVSWVPSVPGYHKSSSTTPETANSPQSSVTSQSTVYYSPTSATNISPTTASPRPPRQEPIQLQLEKQQPGDVIEYFRTNKTAWGYLRSMTTNVQSHGLHNFEQRSFMHDKDGKSESRLAYSPSGYLIGCHSECDIKIPVLDDRHTLIYMYWESCVDGYRPLAKIVDRSMNGLFVDGEALQKTNAVSIQSGQIIQLVGKNRDDVVKFQIYLSLPMIRYRVFKVHRTIEGIYNYSMNEQILGTGSFGNVYRAICKENNKAVALKRMKVDNVAGHVMVALCREVAINVCLKPHPCIIRVENVMEERTLRRYPGKPQTFENYLYIIMELGEGGDMFDFIIKNGPVTETNALIIFDQIFHAIAHLHSQGIAHRDLKLENVVVTNKAKFEVKLCDFGVASFEQQEQPFTTFCGTREYSAPELLFRQSTHTAGYTKSVDIWSLGVMLYAALSGGTPYTGCTATDTGNKDMESMHARIHSGTFPSFDKPLWQNVSERGKQLIQQMLTVDPQQRLNIGQVLEHPWSRDVQKLPDRNPSLKAYLKNPATYNPSS